MTAFAHTYDHISKVTIDPTAKFALVLRKADGTIKTVDSNESPALLDEDNAISGAMFAIEDYEDSCDVFHYGEEYGTAEYVDMTPNSWFSSMQVVFSENCGW